MFSHFTRICRLRRAHTHTHIYIYYCDVLCCRVWFTHCSAASQFVRKVWRIALFSAHTISSCMPTRKVSEFDPMRAFGVFKYLNATSSESRSHVDTDFREILIPILNCPCFCLYLNANVQVIKSLSNKPVDLFCSKKPFPNIVFFFNVRPTDNVYIIPMTWRVNRKSCVKIVRLGLTINQSDWKIYKSTFAEDHFSF